MFGCLRRGKEENGDLDIIVTSKDIKHTTDSLLKRVIEQLSNQGKLPSKRLTRLQLRMWLNRSVSLGYIKHRLWVSGPGTKAMRASMSNYSSGSALHQASQDELDKVCRDANPFPLTDV